MGGEQKEENKEAHPTCRSRSQHLPPDALMTAAFTEAETAIDERQPFLHTGGEGSRRR